MNSERQGLVLSTKTPWQTNKRASNILSISQSRAAVYSNDTRNQSHFLTSATIAELYLTSSWIRTNLLLKPSVGFGVSRTILWSAQGTSLRQGGIMCMTLDPQARITKSYILNEISNKLTTATDGYFRSSSRIEIFSVMDCGSRRRTKRIRWKNRSGSLPLSKAGAALVVHLNVTEWWIVSLWVIDVNTL